MQEETTQRSQKPKTSPKSWMWVLAVLALVVVAGAVRWWYFGQTQALYKEVATQKSIADLSQKEVANLKVEIANLKADPNSPIVKDSDLILAATDAYVRAPVSAANEKFTYVITDNQGEFAKVAVGTAEGTGYRVTLKKVDTNWTVLFAGQDLPLKEVGEKYGLPKGYYHE